MGRYKPNFVNLTVPLFGKVKRSPIEGQKLMLLLNSTRSYMGCSHEKGEINRAG